MVFLDNPLVSVIIPVYNSEAYLPELFDSLSNQTLTNFEMICVDDNSSDDSLRLLNMYAENDSRVSIIALQQNMGAGGARNIALDKVRGQFFCFVDSDDFIEPNMLKDLVEVAQQTNADVVIFGLDQYREQDSTYAPMHHAVVEGKIPAKEVFWPAEIENFYKYMVGFTVNKLYRTEFFKPLAIRFPDIGAHEDMPFTYAAVSAAKRVYYYDETLYHYRRQREGSRSDETNDQFVYMFEALECLMEELMRLGIFKDYEQCFENYVLHMASWKYSETHGLTRMRFHDAFREEWAFKLGVANRNDDYFFIESEKQFLKRALAQPYVNQLEEDLERSNSEIRRLKKIIKRLNKKIDDLEGLPFIHILKRFGGRQD